MAVDRVERRLRRVTAALDQAGIPYAVIGGNAVAAWVGRVDPGATRATKDVDLLVRKEDADRITKVMTDLGFTREQEAATAQGVPRLVRGSERQAVRTRNLHPTMRRYIDPKRAESQIRRSYRLGRPQGPPVLRNSGPFRHRGCPRPGRLYGPRPTRTCADETHVESLDRSRARRRHACDRPDFRFNSSIAARRIAREACRYSGRSC